MLGHRDYNLARFWFEQAAYQVFAKAQFSLGNFYAHGLGSACDPLQACHWYNAAAQQGHSNAIMTLIHLYR